MKIYNFGRVCLSVLCQTITFESLVIRSSFSHVEYLEENMGQVRNRIWRSSGQGQGQGHRS